MYSSHVRTRSWITKADLEEEGTRHVERVTRDIYNDLVERSPVYTGNYRASWSVSFGHAEYVVASGGAPGAPLVPPPFSFPARYRFGSRLYITNGQPYAERIEYGWSGQAPAGVARVTLLKYK